MTKSELEDLLHALTGFDDDFQLSVKTSDDNKIGSICVATDDVDEDYFTYLGLYRDEDGVWCIKL